MNIVKILLFIFVITPFSFSQAEPNFTDYFHIGNASSEMLSLDKIYKYGTWAGSLKNLTDNFNNGKYYLKIYDDSTKTLVYSKGFDSYFGEYQTSLDAQNGIIKAYSESAIIPFPKNKIRFSIEKRNEQNSLEEIFSSVADPSDLKIIGDKIKDNSIFIFEDKDNGDSHKRVDIAVIGEGYTIGEKSKFIADLKKYTEVFFNMEPYKSNRNKFNFFGVLKPSNESGADEPRANIFKSTTLSTTFNSLGSERYLLTEDNQALRDVASNVPYDALLIMVNHKRYGGGGIYNAFCTFTTDNQWSDYLLLHEFGHSFSGLADEYYTSDVAYNDFFPKTVEPVEPNITALLDSLNLKWNEFKTSGIKIPTPWEKAKFDSIDYEWQVERGNLNNRIAELKRNYAPASEIDKAEKEYVKKDKAHTEKIAEYLKSSKFYGMVGAFEGAGYSSKGLYRPMIDCIMFSKGNKPYCKVCYSTIRKIIISYSE